VDTLDYYTTQRVKVAYLRMNSQGLRDRLATVQSRLAELAVVLRDQGQRTVCPMFPAPEGGQWATGWSVPLKPASEDTAVVGASEDDPDPNALCFPQLTDYDLCEPSGDSAAEPAAPSGTHWPPVADTGV
jgi:hypothetical protein